MILSCPSYPNSGESNGGEEHVLSKDAVTESLPDSENSRNRLEDSTGTTLPSSHGSQHKNFSNVNLDSPFGDTNYPVSELEASGPPDNAFLSLLFDVPVTDKSTGLVYRNQRVARCNGVHDTNILYWKIQVKTTVYLHNRALYTFLRSKKNAKLLRLRQDRSSGTDTTVGPTQSAHVNDKNDTHKVVRIPADLHLPEAQRQVLSKGLKFVPLTSTTDKFQLFKDMESFYRRLRLKFHFSHSPTHNVGDDNNNDDDDSKYFKSLRKQKTGWTPNEGDNNALDLFIDKCRHDIKKTFF
ncbi:hypothetical protein ElyMa_004709500 [Elysia marginata]|uniref:Uncharacterized protein n=1 Tax=Elysia marginata TaxID=1093978 RepID=A0AAV4I940_9GAST|nr:hypothetical protein ElyMa_004709500 [Elysia marginata]